MRLSGTAELLPGGHLAVGGCDLVELAQRFGTPLWVVDEEEVRSNCRAFVNAFQNTRRFPGGAEVVYASKALLTMAVCRVIAEEGLALDVVSGGELYAALRSGFPAERIHFHGNNKKRYELSEALEAGIGRFIVDNFDELSLLSDLASPSAPANVVLRLTPGIAPDTHDFIKTGQIDSKFGFPIGTGEALEAVRRALAAPSIALRGIHCHVGSQVFETRTHALAATVMADFAAEARSSTGWLPEEINLGGGFAVRYNGEEHHPPSPGDYAEAVSRALLSRAAELGIEPPKLLVEPGRAIVAPAGWTLYMVGSVKDIPGVRTYVLVDGGMTDNPRPALYGARYEACLANRGAETRDGVFTIAGCCCESGDILIHDISLPRPEPGDLVAVSMTGAYNHAMASNYNRLPRPAMVLVADGHAELILERETYADLIARERVPARLTSRRASLPPPLSAGS